MIGLNTDFIGVGVFEAMPSSDGWTVEGVIAEGTPRDFGVELSGTGTAATPAEGWRSCAGSVAGSMTAAGEGGDPAEAVLPILVIPGKYVVCP